jgi:hypothetical protein
MTRPAVSTPGGVLIVRVWSEHEVEGLRARVIDASEGDESLRATVAVAAGIDDIVAVLRAWLEQIAGSQPRLTTR